MPRHYWITLGGTPYSPAYSSMDTPLAQQRIDLENKILEQGAELAKLKWIVVQLIQRMGKDMVLLHMDNPVAFGIAVHEDANKRLIDVRIKRTVEKKDNASPDSSPGPAVN